MIMSQWLLKIERLRSHILGVICVKRLARVLWIFLELLLSCTKPRCKVVVAPCFSSLLFPLFIYVLLLGSVMAHLPLKHCVGPSPSSQCFHTVGKNRKLILQFAIWSQSTWKRFSFFYPENWQDNVSIWKHADAEFCEMLSTSMKRFHRNNKCKGFHGLHAEA